MVRLTKIYTRTGDDGSTGLGDGSRVTKHGARVSAYGSVDEANATLGVARLHVDADIDRDLARVQNDLFDLGADLCTPEVENPPYEPLRIVETQITWLEQRIDEMNNDLPSLRSFILPGGSVASAHLHVARTMVRAAERQVSALAEEAEINPLALQYINRLSDYLFVVARWANREQGDVLWVPGAHRG